MNKELQFLLYRSADEDVSVDAIVKDETVWLTQKGMAELFGVQTPAISKHLKNIFEEGELNEAVVVSKMERTTLHGAIPEKHKRKRRTTVIGFFDYIEDHIDRENTFTMEEFSASINEFLTFRKYKILPDRGKISKQMALDKAGSEYDEFNKTQKITSDFDREVKKLLERGGKADE